MEQDELSPGFLKWEFHREFPVGFPGMEPYTKYTADEKQYCSPNIMRSRFSPEAGYQVSITLLFTRSNLEHR